MNIFYSKFSLFLQPINLQLNEHQTSSLDNEIDFIRLLLLTIPAHPSQPALTAHSYISKSIRASKQGEQISETSTRAKNGQ